MAKFILQVGNVKLEKMLASSLLHEIMGVYQCFAGPVGFPPYPAFFVVTILVSLNKGLHCTQLQLLAPLTSQSLLMVLSA